MQWSALARSLGWLVIAGSALACGLRTEPSDYNDVPGSEAGEGPARTCEDPGVLPTTSSMVRSALTGTGMLSGFCGEDVGPEAVYRFTPVEPTDVVIEVTEVADDLSLCVLQGECASEDAVILCHPNLADGDARTFYAAPGSDYYVVLDSEEESAAVQSYAFDVNLGPPPIDLCPVHEEVLEQSPGRVFSWNNDFSPGYGRVTGACGGAGKENMFRVEVESRGRIVATVFGDNGFEPILGLRTGCGGTTELACWSGDGEVAFLDFEFTAAGTYYLLVDSATDAGGEYALEVAFL